MVFAAHNTPTKIKAVCPGGTTSTVLMAADGLASPTATAVGGRLSTSRTQGG
ncbi:hypothetical protein ABZ471_39320 [Streptomyces sp. NPDC005728]|uniref:hypothetical protein n=1 Tax=Streptomyces sp. NPDC005728 TaxID=3157054 RepID=UPI0033CFCBDD